MNLLLETLVSLCRAWKVVPAATPTPEQSMCRERNPTLRHGLRIQTYRGIKNRVSWLPSSSLTGEKGFTGRWLLKMLTS